MHFDITKPFLSRAAILASRHLAELGRSELMSNHHASCLCVTCHRTHGSWGSWCRSCRRPLPTVFDTLCRRCTSPMCWLCALSGSCPCSSASPPTRRTSQTSRSVRTGPYVQLEDRHFRVRVERPPAAATTSASSSSSSTAPDGGSQSTGRRV